MAISDRTKGDKHPSVLASAFALLLLGTSAQALAAPRVAIEGGTVEGASERNFDVFKGIPFAAPPLGGASNASGTRWRVAYGSPW